MMAKISQFRKHLQRGIIITPEVCRVEQANVTGQARIYLNPAALRCYLVYWDSLVLLFPEAPLVEFNLEQEVNFLESETILTTHAISMEGKMDDQAFYALQSSEFSAKEQSEPEKWSIARPNTSYPIPRTIPPNEGRRIQIQLHNQLPVPSDLESLDTILEFKRKHHNLIVAFRAAMHSLYLEASKQIDPSLSELVPLTKLQHILKDLELVANESFHNFKNHTIITDLFIPTYTLRLGQIPYRGDIHQRDWQIIGTTQLATTTQPILLRLTDHSPIPPGLDEKLKDYAYVFSDQQEAGSNQ